MTDLKQKSESEMSVLIDATPIKKGGKKKEKVRCCVIINLEYIFMKEIVQASGKAKKDSKEKTTKKPKTELSKDEEAVKRLKVLLFS